MVDLPAEVTAVRETDDVYRVYRPEWVTVHLRSRSCPSSGSGLLAPLVAECREFFASQYAGRVRPEDMEVAVTAELGAQAKHRQGNPATYVARLRLRLPNLKGEFKNEAHAHAFVAARGWQDATVLVRNSRGDHELRSYGRKLLPAEDAR
jgi:hypothetical protein